MAETIGTSAPQEIKEAEMKGEPVRKENKERKRDLGIIFQVIIIVILGVIVAYYLGKGGIGGGGVTGNVISNTLPSVSASEILPQGIPEIYGKELGVSFDDVSTSQPEKADATIGKLGKLDTSLTMAGDDLKRYIGIASRISCEYCCGADSIIDSKGEASCGCAHSFAMRGLAKYLIKNHPSMSDDAILEEMGKWKVLFFPEQHQTKAAVLKSKGIALNYINLASQKYRGIEQGQSSGDMVGGC